MSRGVCRMALAAWAALALAGCLQYRLGTTLPEELRSVHVPSVRNRTEEPGIDRLASSLLLRELQREGTLSLATESEAATQLLVTVVRFAMEPVRYSRHDARTPDEYRAVAMAEVRFANLRTGEALFEGMVEGEATFPTGTDLVSAKEEMLAAVCQDLARRIIDRCVSVW